MRRLWLHTVRAYLRLGLFFYFKKIDVRRVDSIPKYEAVLFLGNHQNALLDALLIAAKNDRFSYFLTRASVFSKPIISNILKSLLMLPVYRIRDGWANLTKNNSVFSESSKLLSKKEAIVIFPEGSHNLKRTVRPLSKGFTRIIFETLEQYPNAKINLIPVGLNFANATQFGDSTLVNFGKVIEINTSILNDKNKGVSDLKALVFDELCQLTTHIESEHYDTKLKALKNLNVDFTKPERVNACLKSNFVTCESRPVNTHGVFKVFSKFLLICCLIVPYVIWKKVVKPKIKEVEFISTFRFAMAITLVPIFLLIVFVLLSTIFQFQIGALYLIFVIVLVLLAVKL
ncbi:1-acyl-sn-glycerol-3-phosphate acyltransferase [uncultured Psychroserpens sp.]|uniref:1-acyl-sn-glycerol-3-phosphate acyltransferase n=1 Tax=uncultured Psychroserpens sp. TaxID=255436 RepID=UPI002606073E|nr:1-acyl-sn-glycerol-3-phosphate acyltransferase [uncultured Psychroserpens sp.]